MGYINSDRVSQYKIFENTMSSNDIFSTLMLIDFNLTELCNRTCEFCPRHDSRIYPNKDLHMDINLLNKIIDELAILKYKNRILFCGFGEPLLYKHIYHAINITKSKLPWNNNIQLVTNGDKLNENVINNLFSNGLDKLYISLYDGSHQETYFKNLFLKMNIEENKYFFHHYYKNKSKNYGFVHLSNRAGKIFKETHEGGCNTPFYEINIDYNGNTLLCAHDWDKSVITGNLLNQSLKDIWVNSNILNNFRKMLISKREKTPCSSCNIIGTLYGEKSKEILCNAIK